jgi:hypothetical protein
MPYADALRTGAGCPVEPRSACVSELRVRVRERREIRVETCDVRKVRDDSGDFVPNESDVDNGFIDGPSIDHIGYRASSSQVSVRVLGCVGRVSEWLWSLRTPELPSNTNPGPTRKTVGTFHRRSVVGSVSASARQ